MKHLIVFLIAWIGVLLPVGLQAMEAHVLDVGEGQAVLLVSEEHGLLIDTGHFGKAEQLRRALKRYGVNDVGKVILTHLDADHASGIFFIQFLFPKTVVFESGHRMDFNPCFDAYRWVAEKLDSGDWQVKTLRQGDRLNWRGIEINVLWPVRPEGNLLNPNSLVLHVSDTEDSWLVMGDVGLPQEKRMLDSGILPEEVDVLVVGHHGAGDATSMELLEHTSPKYAVISTNADNIRGYPSEIVVHRLQQQGAVVHLVHEQGDFNWPRGKTSH